LIALVGAAVLLGATVWLTQTGPVAVYKSTNSIPNSVVEDFNAWKIKYHKKLAGADETYRLNVFYKNSQYIKKQNSKETQFTMNQFGDLTNLEFKSTYMGYKNLKTSSENVHNNTDRSPGAVDWR